MKRHLFWRIFLLYAITMLVTIVFMELYIANAVRNNHITELRKHLTAQAALISNDISFKAPLPSLDSDCRQFKKQTGSRVTLIALDGRVLGDSDTESSRMENHAGRPEIQQALLSGTGMFIRYSATLHHELLYVAKKVMRGAFPAGFVRLSIPLKTVETSIDALRIKIIAVVMAVLLASTLFLVGQLERIRRLTKQIAVFSRSLADGAIGNKLYLERASEFDEIAGSLNTMSVKLQNSMITNEEENNRLQVILQSIPEVLVILDAKGIIQQASSVSKQYFGDVTLAGRQIFEVLRNAHFLSLMEESRKNLLPVLSELRLDYPEERFFSARISPLFYQKNELSGFLIMLHDITQLKKLEQTRKDFVANISHEIKTPITSIKGFADTLIEGALHDTEHAERFLRIIKSNSERIDSLVDDLMTISKIELGVVKIEKSPVDIADVFDHVLVMLRTKADNKKLYLKTELPESPVIILADKDKLIQVLTNLVDNAIKFTEKGGVTIGARREDGKTLLSVEDTGIGVLEKHLPRLGERFYRVDTARSRKMGGTGLGLAIVKHLVKAHGWDMLIESVPEKGTKVSIACT